ncbi:MAG: cysteine hydrolase [Rhodoferax sp.]|nr:cysteine hydrolase [Rhodoferax sp.]
MNRYDLLIIDPQNDFMDLPGAALPVPGATADMDRLARWLQQEAEAVQSVTVTLDSHPSLAVERTPFWLDEQGAEVPAFTVIRAAHVRAGRWRPRHAACLAEVLVYLDALESQGRHQLIVWPVHCVLGTWGHNLHAGLAASLADWELRTGRWCHKVLKGQHPLTEQYSAFRAEVPRADDPCSQNNEQLMHRLSDGAPWLLVAGEALSHCVAASLDDMMAQLPADRLARTVLLVDCMSPVAGFEEAGTALLDRARGRGVRVARLDELTDLAA